MMLAENMESLQLNGKAHSSQCPDSSQSVHSPNLLRGESLVPFRWESITALDIAAVLDSTFPANSASSRLTCEEGYALYDDDDFWMQPEFMLRGEIENDPICEDENVMNATSSEDLFATNISQPGEDGTSLFISSQDEEGLADCSWSNVNGFTEIGEITSLSSFGEMADETIRMERLASSLPSLQGRSTKKESALQLSNSSLCGETRDSAPVIESSTVSSITQCSSADTRSEMTASQQSWSEMDIKPQLQLPMSASDANESFDGKKQARARRVAANQRRAGGRSKKYLPYNIIPTPHTICRSGTIERSSSERVVVHFPSAQQPLQPVGMAPGAQYQSAVSSLPAAVNGIEHQMVNEALESGVIEQLKNCVRQLDEQTRLCIRDSLYRLARSAKERQNEAESRLINKFMKKTTSSRISREGAVEAETNPLDRWVVNLLFYKQPNLSNISSQSYIPFSAEATSQVMLQSTIMNQASQPWNSCGFVPDFRLCTC